MKVVHLNVGGHHYKVSCSLLDIHPNSLLAQSAAEQRLSDPEEEVFLDCDGHRFRLVLDYLRGDGHVKEGARYLVVLSSHIQVYHLHDVAIGVLLLSWGRLFGNCWCLHELVNMDEI